LQKGKEEKKEKKKKRSTLSGVFGMNSKDGDVYV